MNIYDFDDTIFAGDSSKKFILYSLKRHPFLVISCLFKGGWELICGSSIGMVKSKMFSFVKDIPNWDDYINNFIIKYQKNIKNFYLENQQKDDVIISASFDFIIEPFCRSLGIKNIIATKFDLKKGSIIGRNCKGPEKIKRFREIFPNAKVANAYSDSLTDIPMFEIAKKAYLVKKDQLIPYEINN